MIAAVRVEVVWDDPAELDKILMSAISSPSRKGTVA